MFMANIESGWHETSRWQDFAAFTAGASAVALAVLLTHRAEWSVAPTGHHHVHAQSEARPSSVMPDRPATVVTPLSCSKLPNVPGKSVTTAVVDFPPNAYTPRHRHSGSVTAFVLKGVVRSQMEGEPASTYGVGQTWFESPGAIHLFAENPSKTEAAQLLAIFVADDDCGPLTIPD
jgi:quercetin dioxygenase-like cupin family protein